jgi:hypothetical protein
MARTNLPLVTLDPSVGLTNPTATAVDVANGMNIVLASGALPRGPTAWDIVIQFNNTFAGAKSIIVRAGISPVPAFRGTIGDLSVSNTTQTSYVGPLDPSRYGQADGSINIDFTAATTGTVMAIAIPHRGVKA